MKSAPILIIDKTGLIGEPLSLKLSKEFLVIFVSSKPSANIPFSGRYPVIPDNKYSHIVVVEDEELDLEFLPKVVEKARNTNSDFIFAKRLLVKERYIVDKVLGLYPSAKVVLYGDIFDNKLILRGENFKSVINKFIYQAQRFGKIQIPGDGLINVYPVHITDVVDGLIDLVFGINDLHSLFYIFPKHPPSELSLAHMIQKANPEIKIDFIKYGPKREDISYPLGGKNLLDDKYPIAKKIRNIDIKKTINTDNQKNSKESPSSIKRFPILVVWILIFLVLSPLVFTLIFSFLGLNTLYFAKNKIGKGNFSNVKSSLHLSNTFFYVGKKTSDILYIQGKIIGLQNNLKKILEDIDLGYRVSEGALHAFNAEIYFSKIMSGKSENPQSDFAKGKSYLKSSIIIFEKIKADGKIPDTLLQNLEIIDPFIKLLSNTSDILPGIFGMEGPRTYLLLFQNNMILRPGGGFIGSYGILKVKLGRITEFSIHDVYDADGQLKGHVEPPFAIRRHLPTNHWYLRDSNFDVDFVKSASSSSNFLSVETGERADGVIGVDVSFVKNILHVIGPVYVENYKETVDENNLYILTQTHSEEKFLRSLYRAMMVKISDENIDYLLLAEALSDSISQKHLIFAFNNNTQNIFTVNGWSSSLWDERKNDEKVINDFLAIVEANLGVNKVNYFISRNLTHKVTIGDNGSISEELNISYKNTSNARMGGEYKNYLRIILPLNTIISEISINGTVQTLVDAVTDPLIYEAKNFKPPDGLEIEKINQDNKAVYGFIVKVPVGEITKIKIKYALAGNVSGLDAFSYNLKLFKQPGIDSLPYSFSLKFPNSLDLIKGNALYSKKIVKDENLVLDFAKK